MQNSYYNHPAEEALERFLLHQCPEEELETVETHILACGSCISRLEALEASIADLRLGFEQLRYEQSAATAKQHRSWKMWFTLPNLAWAGAAAVAVVGIALTPELLHRQAPAADVTLQAYRGMEVVSVPEGRPLHVHMSAADLPAGVAMVELVNETGALLWQTRAQIRHDAVDVNAPQIAQPGSYFFRLYAAGPDGHAGELLREFALQAK